MAISHLGITLISMIFLGGSLVLLWFLILSGLTHTSPLDDTYFLKADTGRISGASRSITQWTYFRICGEGNLDCDSAYPALPIGYAWKGENPPGSGAPPEVVGGYGDDTTSFQYWYLWRFGTVFYLITLFFEVIAFFFSFLACCGGLGGILTGFVAGTAFLFNTAAVSLMTATFVKLRNAFQADGRDASLGTYAFGFAWGSWAALLISTILFCLAGGRGKDQKQSTGRGWWRRGKSIHSRKSYDGRRVKEEYP